MKQMFVRYILVGATFAALCFSILDAALAQAPSPVRPNADRVVLNQRFTFFYRDPRLAEVPDLISQWRAAHGPVAPLLGFLIGVSAKYPDQIDRMFPSTLDNGAQRLAVLGVRVGVSEQRARSLAQHFGWPEKDMIHVASGTSVDKLVIRIPADQDIFWGASFATGDARYVQRILQHYVSAANRKDIDLDQVMVLIRGVPGYSPQILKEIQQKEGDQKVRDLLMASAALWSLTSNAAQHDFVRKAVDGFIAANPNSQATAGLRKLAAIRDAARTKGKTP